MAKEMIGWLKIGLLVLVVGCASSGLSVEKDSNRNDASSMTVTDSSLTLADYLRKVAGVDVRGTAENIRVYIRGINTISGRNEPLFVVDGSRLGRSYQRVSSLVAVDDIDRIRVLKGSDAGARYGLEGNAGVIEIETKRN
ncbi:TonB-dependent receptor plug domain-containing protein [Fodinibius salsisoli]|uniref:TonB-dependent receptor plug domain-containing protein n=1 Tax=Fodinibius salsisoli TaxID=2820877 RepID=A0ABT3PMH9_9BACT|nr:TonB-dependent receptor plug domain-containing protein [Fodinibius salsisoli]MCW9707114.1 TonB-dependent receptor plug domain-containing protein [Fodinibius salsisoli]